MHFKPLRDLGFLIGHELMQVCVGRYEVILNFDRAASVTVLGPFAVGGGARQTVPDGARALLPLLSMKTTSATMLEGADAVLEFEHGPTLRLFNDAEAYEQYRIVAPGHDVIV